MPDLRPLIGIAALTDLPEAEVLLVGTPDACMAARGFELGYACVTLPRGAAAADVDLSPLAGRAVVVWPDAGDDGMRAADLLAQALPEAHVIPPPSGSAAGWNLSTAHLEGWTSERVRTHIAVEQHRIVDALEALRRGAEQAPPEANGHADADPFAANGAEAPPDPAPDPSEPPFLFLGQTYGEFKYLSKKSQQITSLSAQGHAKLNLLTLAPLDWWESIWSSKSGCNWGGAANWMIQRSLSRPIFRAERIRGRGCWLDEGRVIFHAGDRIILDGKSVPISNFKSDFIYERNTPVDHDESPPLSSSEAAKFLSLCDMLPWTMPILSRFLAGWCVLAPICGALGWRPHLWLTGASGSGKTTALNDIIAPALGSFRQKFLGATTEAGIRQNVRADAIPVLMDEAESESARGVVRMQGILELIRQASSETGGLIAKGTVTGESTLFNVRSCFLLSSVGVGATSRPDVSRVTIASLEKRHDTARYHALLAAADVTTHNPAWCASLRARTRNQIPTILGNARHFITATTARLGDSRAGDQIGTLIAGAFSLTSSKPITAEFAQGWVAEQDWTGFETDAAETDENLALARLLQAKLRVDAEKGSPWTTSVGDQIAAFYAPDGTPDSRSTASAVLRLHGVRVDEKGIAVSNTHAALADIYRETPWALKWKDQLGRISGAQRSVAVNFNGATNRAVVIPRRAVV